MIGVRGLGRKGSGSRAILIGLHLEIVPTTALDGSAIDSRQAEPPLVIGQNAMPNFEVHRRDAIVWPHTAITPDS